MDTRLDRGPKRWGVSFVGQILADDAVHSTRARVLERVREPFSIAVFSPDGVARPQARLRAWLRRAAGRVGRLLLRLGVSETRLARFPRFARAAAEPRSRGHAMSRALRAAIRPPAFGLAMYQVLHDSGATLNVHADSSPRFASNMRLFEATGVGTCLVTDWKENLESLFELDREVVAYRSVEELEEKLRWLESAPAEREAIAAAGRKRALREHTYSHRAERLDAMIRDAIR